VFDEAALLQTGYGADLQNTASVGSSPSAREARGEEETNSANGRDNPAPHVLRVDVMEVLSWAEEAARMSLSSDPEAGTLPGVMACKRPPKAGRQAVPTP